MRSNSEAVIAALIAALVLVPALPAAGVETSTSEIVIIQPDDTLDDDLYAGAVRVIIEGEITGDVIAFAAEEVVVEGTVGGSLMAVSPRVRVAGEVAGSVRVSGGTLEVAGEVGGDVVAAVLDARLAPDSRVDGDVLAWARAAEMRGSVGGGIEGTQTSLLLEGEVGGDVDVTVGSLELAGPLTVSGDLGYRSRLEAEGIELAVVEGTSVRKTPLPPNLRVRALGVFARMLAVLFVTIAAVTVAYVWPKRTESAISRLRAAPFGSWWRGAVILAFPFLLAALGALVVTLAPPAAGFPLLAVIVPVVLTAFGVAFALALLAAAPAAGRLGAGLFARLDLYGAIVAGSVIAGLVWLIPWLGWLVPILLLPAGLGAWMLGPEPEPV